MNMTVCIYASNMNVLNYNYYMVYIIILRYQSYITLGVILQLILERSIDFFKNMYFGHLM